MNTVMTKEKYILQDSARKMDAIDLLMISEWTERPEKETNQQIGINASNGSSWKIIFLQKLHESLQQ